MTTKLSDDELKTKKTAKQIEEKKQMKEGLKLQHKKWYDNKIFFIISLILAAGTFIGGYFVRLYALADVLIQSFIFVIAVGFFVLPLSYIFNKFWMLFMRTKEEPEKIE